ncbi:hypothetical protein P692DRAFT_20653645, partial [Suillus brevipes Sb2]
PSPLDADEEVLCRETYSSVSQDDLRTSLAFVVALQKASLDDPDTGLDPEAIERLRNPLQDVPSIEDDDTAAAIELYLKLSHAESNYNSAREVFDKYRKQGQDDIPSLHRVKKIFAELTGVEHVLHDMCIDSCVGFAGPFMDLVHCPKCGKSRYDETRLQETGGRVKVPVKQFPTLPVGPQLQALYRDPDSAASMHW